MTNNLVDKLNNEKEAQQVLETKDIFTKDAYVDYEKVAEKERQRTDVYYEKGAEDERNRTEKLKNDSLEQDIRARKEYANKIFALICCWIVFLGIFLLLVGFSCIKLSDGVLIAFIGGTTANVLGIFMIVAKYIFNPSQTK